MHELFAALRHRAANTGGALAFDDGTTRLDFAGLAGRVAAAAEALRPLDPTAIVGVLGGNRVESVIAQLAAWHAGKMAVPLPPFFSIPQLRLLAADAGLSLILAAPGAIETARQLDLPVIPISDRIAAWPEPAVIGAGQIIYSSGTTGQPKGVLFAGGQLLWSARALSDAMLATMADAYFSVLPLALLLETLCAILIPILAGASVRFEPALAAGLGDIDGGAMAMAVALSRPSCMVLVPHLLAEWVRAITRGGPRPPDSLRFVAVGGAPLAPVLAEKAWRLGIPVHEGYGLSECGSVVALNRPGERKPGTVGKPLTGLDVTVRDREIVVTGPPVMDGYLNSPRIRKAWRTGDIGEIGADGYLTVNGRRDHILVTPLGRNINPEWIEALLTADLRVACSLVTHVTGPHLTALLVPSPSEEAWFDCAAPEDIGALIEICCAEAPYYAVPRHAVVVPARELIGRGLFTASGRLRRREVLDSDLLAHAKAVPVSAAARELAQ